MRNYYGGMDRMLRDLAARVEEHDGFFFRHIRYVYRRLAALEADLKRRQEIDATRPLKTEMDTLVEHEMRLRALEGSVGEDHEAEDFEPAEYTCGICKQTHKGGLYLIEGVQVCPDCKNTTPQPVPDSTDASRYVCEHCAQPKKGDCYFIRDGEKRTTICPDCMAKIPTDPPALTPKPAPKKDAPKAGWRIAISDEPAPCPTCGQMVYTVTFKEKPETQPEPATAVKNEADKPTPKADKSDAFGEDICAGCKEQCAAAGGANKPPALNEFAATNYECTRCGNSMSGKGFSVVGKDVCPECYAMNPAPQPAWENAQYIGFGGGECYRCALCDKEYWGDRWMIMWQPGAICHDCYWKVKKESEKPAPKPGEVWITHPGACIRPAVAILGKHPTRGYRAMWLESEAEGRTPIPTFLKAEYLLRPATTDEADAFWGR